MGRFFDLEAIKKVLPQRAPMLMLDAAEQLDETRFAALKCLTVNELFFQGHFPGHPIMPGVLQVEAMRQLTELAASPVLRSGNGRSVFMKRVEKVKFRRPNLPGDRVKIEVEMLSLSAEEAVAKASCSNASGVSSEAVITLGLRPRSAAAALPVGFNEFDRTGEIALDTEKVMSLMPHRYPFLFIDYIAKVEGDHVLAVKNITGNEPFFTGAGDAAEPVISEAILCEIAAQSGCALVLSRPENEGKIGYFMSIDKAESLRPVRVGDQLVCDIFLPPAKSRFGKGSGQIKVNGELVFEITLMFAIVEP